MGRQADYRNNTGNETVYGSFRIIINKIRSLNPDTKILLITPMQRIEFVYIGDAGNNAYGSHKEKNGQTLKQFADAVGSIGKAEGFDVLDVYHKMVAPTRMPIVPGGPVAFRNGSAGAKAFTFISTMMAGAMQY